MRRFHTAKEALSEAFGFAAFRPFQEEIVNTVISGQDALVIMPTGGGKSLCYQIPALVREGTAVVVSPLIALMQDQIRSEAERGFAAECLSSANSLEENREIEKRFLSGNLDFLYVTPERLVNEWTLGLLRRGRVSLFAVDEAHCVVIWGRDFRPEYGALSVLKERFPDVPRVALTATADEAAQKEISEKLLVSPRRFVASFDRPNIRYRVTEGAGDARRKMLSFIKLRHPGESGIVYCLSRKQSESVAAYLRERDVPALPYHAGMEPEERERNQRVFLGRQVTVMVATVAFGMGIDKPDVRFVIHLGLPKSVESYFQETGRAGRDGLPADAWLIWGWRDVMVQQRFIDESTGDDAFKRESEAKLDSMVGYAETPGCRRHYLLSYFGEKAPEHCGNCDNCSRPPDVEDRTIEAQKLVSCVLRCERASGRGFGMGHVISVLMGRSTPEIEACGHRKLSTWGIGRDLSEEDWKRVARVLIARRILVYDWESGVLRPRRTMGLLKGRETVLVRMPDGLPPANGRTRKPFDVPPASKKLADALKSWRSRASAEAGIPAYAVLTNVSLSEIACAKPRTLYDLSHVTGIGEKKLATYGERILELVREFG
ncbi:MAG: DNA helicase RecQ [Sutterellaceae bacterium]|nr:DNA helicase RecQ [Sutterellaceae bacterium]MDD7441716.1 DNA helicase RecQ [Sutterellaceae bacterium]MDY2869274.1 DNA helicase RecQ [Mesosutterella sp.]